MITLERTVGAPEYKYGYLNLTTDNGITQGERTDSIQIETNLNEGTAQHTKIVWLNDCEYELSYLSGKMNATDSISNFIKTLSLKTKILKTARDYYLFESEFIGIDKKLLDTMWVFKKIVIK